MEERARLIIMKKKRNDQRGGRSMERVASGIAMKASPIDCYNKTDNYLSKLNSCLTVTTLSISAPSARLPRIAKMTKPAKREVRELQIPTMKASRLQLLWN